MPKSAKQLREERAKLIAQARQLYDEHEGDQWTADREAQFDKMMDDAQDMEAQAKRIERLETIEAGLSDPVVDPLPAEHPFERPDRQYGETVHDERTLAIRGYGYRQHGNRVTPLYHRQSTGQRGTPEYRQAFSSYLRHGEKGLRPEQYATLQSDNAEQAGYLVASEQFAAELLKEVDDLLFIRRYAKIHTVREAGSLGIRKRTARASTFSWSSELEVATQDTSLKYGKRVLTPHHLTGQVRVSRDLLRRSMQDVDGVVREEMSRDAGEVMEDAYLSGSGDRQPLGVFTASSDGISTDRDVQTGSATSITADGLIDAKYSLKGQYRNGARGPIRWLFHRDAIKLIAKLKDANNQYLLRTGLGLLGDDPTDDLLGYPVDESERVPNTFTTGKYVGLLANWRYYEIADALDLEIQMLLELFSLTNEVGYVGRLKTDGMPTLEEAFVRLITN